MLQKFVAKIEGPSTDNNKLAIMGHGPQFDGKKSLKTDMSKFPGDDVEGWLYKVKKYFHFHNVPEGRGSKMDPMDGW